MSGAVMTFTMVNDPGTGCPGVYTGTATLGSDGNVIDFSFTGKDSCTGAQVGNGEASNSIVLDSPTSALASPGDGKVSLTWPAAANATSYNVYCSTSPDFTTSSSTRIATVTGNYFVQQGVTNGVTYYYRVTATMPLRESTPTPEVSATPGRISISSAVSYGDHAYAVTDKGALVAWGDNTGGEIGDGSTVTKPFPLFIFNLASGDTVVTGHNHSFIVRGDGSVLGWGSNSQGQLGDGTAVDKKAPTLITALTDVKAISAGDSYSVALKKDGTVWVWGSDGSCQLGDGRYYLPLYPRYSPYRLGGFTDVVTSIAAGLAHTLFLQKDGTVWAAGSVNNGRLYNNTYPLLDVYSSPTLVKGIANVASIYIGGTTSYAMKSDGTVWAWGWNAYGQLGDGTTTSTGAPKQVAGLGAVAALAAGDGHAVALKADGTVWTWGNNANGQLGDGTTVGKGMPVQVVGLSEVKAVYAGANHSMALKKDGTLWVWGSNQRYQLGNPQQINLLTPTRLF